MKRKRERHHAYKGIFILDLLYKLYVKGKIFNYHKTLTNRQYRHYWFTHGGRMGSLDNGIIVVWAYQLVLFFILNQPDYIHDYLDEHEFLLFILFIAPLIVIVIILKDGPWYYTNGKLSEIDADTVYEEQPLVIRILYQFAYIFLALAVMALPFIVAAGLTTF